MIVVVAVALIVLAPSLLCFVFYRWFRKKGWVKAAWIFPILLLAYGYIWYDALYPSDRFYKDEFVEITNTPLPASAKVIHKSASYPDQHGDYSSCAVIIVSSTDFETLFQKIKSDSSFSLMNQQSLFIGSTEFNDVAHDFTDSDYLSKFSGAKSKYAARWGAYVLVAFLADRKTIIIYRASS